MKYTMDLGMWGSVFAVPTQIVDHHLKLCGAAHLKVLLTLLRRAGEGMELSELAVTLNLMPEVVQEALDYWLNCGVLAARETDGGTVLQPPTAQPQAAPAPVPEPPQPLAALRPARTNSAPPIRPKPLEIQKMIATDSGLKAFLAEAEATLGELISSADLSTLVSLYSWAGISPDVLLIAIGYCKHKKAEKTGGKTKVSLRYIESVATDWQDKGIDTLEKADRLVKDLLDSDAHVTAVADALGLQSHIFTVKEKTHIRQWFEEFHFEIPLIRLAYERSEKNTDGISIPYIGKILERWYKKGVKSPEDAAREEDTFSRKRPEKAASSYDLDEIEERLLRGSPKLN